MSNSEYKGLSNYSKFDSMATALLEELLQADLDAPEAEQLTPEEALYIAGLLAERRGTVNKDMAAAKAEFYEHYYPMVEKEERLFYSADGEETEPDTEISGSKPENSKNNLLDFAQNAWRRLAGAVAVLALIMFAGTVTAYALGNDPFVIIDEWSEDSSWLENGMVTSELAEAVAEYSEADLVPQWLPNGYTLNNVVVGSWQHNLFINAYSLQRNRYIYIFYNNYSDKAFFNNRIEQIEMISDKAFAHVTRYTVQDICYYILGTDWQRTIVWQNGEFIGTVIGQFSLDDAMKIIDSIHSAD